MIQTVAKERIEKYQILRDIFENQTTQPMAYNGSHKIQQPKARFATDVTSIRNFAETHGLHLPPNGIPVSLAGLAYVSHEHLRNGMGTTGMHLRQDAQSMKKVGSERMQRYDSVGMVRPTSWKLREDAIQPKSICCRRMEWYTQ